MDKQTAKLVARIAENLPEMEGEVMQGWIDKPKELQSFLLGLNPPKTSPAPQPLLEFVRTTTAPDTSEPFIANAKFKLKKDGGICSYLGDNFNAWFLAGTGNIDAPGGETTLTIARLTKASVDQLILDELGDKTDVALVDVFAKMEAQSKGQRGELLVDGRANIFYIRDQDGVLRTVDVSWSGVGWYVNAGSTGDAGRWVAAYQVFSRNSALTYSAP